MQLDPEQSQNNRIETNKQWWRELNEFADANDIISFWAHYSKYLEWANTISPQRKVLKDMVDRTVHLLRNKY